MDARDHATKIREQAEAAGALRDPQRERREAFPLTAVKPEDRMLGELQGIRMLLEKIHKDVEEIKGTIQESRTR